MEALFVETPMYGISEAAHYLRVPYTTIRYWTRGNRDNEPVVNLALADPPRLSFMNLLECHMLSALRSVYSVRLPKVRAALITLANIVPSDHPLIDAHLETDNIDIFLRELKSEEIINVSRWGQRAMKDVLRFHLKRIDTSAEGMLRFFPFVEEKRETEPKVIVMTPTIAFGRPVISGTAIPTALVASRFHARESVPDLAKEYQVTVSEIEEAIRLESRSLAA